MRKKSNLLQRNSKGKNIPTQQETLMGNNQARQRSTDTQTTLNQKPSKAIFSRTYFRGDCFLYAQKTAKSSKNK